jgi:hypothetical protein
VASAGNRAQLRLDTLVAKEHLTTRQQSHVRRQPKAFDELAAEARAAHAKIAVGIQ